MRGNARMNTIPDYVREIKDANLFILIVSIILLLGISLFMVYCLIRFSRKNNPTPSQTEGHLGLEILWTVLPTILVMIMFYWGLIGFQSMRSVPKDAMVVKVYGKQWSWLFVYENGIKSPELVVPVGKPVKCLIYSEDVLHSLYIPQYLVKEDAVPGMENYLWFYPDKEGVFDIFCAEYCGEHHSYMLTKLVIKSQEDYDSWFKNAGKLDGRQLVKTLGCIACHHVDSDQKLVGPGFKGLWGKQEVVITGGKERTITINEEYLRTSILDPMKDIVKDFPAAMTAQKVNEEEIKAIIEFLKKHK